MTDNIKRVTPREIIDMVMDAEVHGDTQFVLATAHDFEIQCFRARVAAHDAEILRLRARVEVLERQHPVVAGCQCPPGANAQCANHWCPRQAVAFRVTSGSAP